ncbi:hypothetical protein MPSI1_002734 [Malassezia psittaci]|uniref:Uncharacterized protein n=1 Tax=Malassezia psittaci TaxID=1821823 RepID=A0AAF0JF59_9BASI|nr:hypothetical protein MPSI1_002734 [Malassezia psittaci]
MAHGTPTVESATSGAARLKPSFRLVPEDELTELSEAPSVDDSHMVSYGYHDGSPRPLPAHLVRYIEPTEAEFDQQVEYDMDEQDQAWLSEVNDDRRKEQLDVLPCETFEIVMDRLEKEWFTLVKRIPSRFSFGAQDDDQEFPDDSLCAICDSNECENLNAIVFCDGCNLAVHQDCYGIPYIPEGQWLCRKCTVSPDRPVSCVLCPNEGGAFKQTTQGAWAHLLCAIWIPETGVGNPVYMEPIDGVNTIPKARWRLRCYLCNKRTGACIQCEHRSCFTAFHVVCASRVGLLSRARRNRAEDADADAEDANDTCSTAYCHHHLPPDEKVALRQRVQNAKQVESAETSANLSDDESDVSTRDLIVSRSAPPTSTGESIALKSARAYNKLYSAGPLPVPNYLVHRVLAYIARISIRRKVPTIGQIVRYWSLKRQEMRGAPLLKRLHIEPWTVGNFVDERTSALKLAKLQYLYRLREDLEKVRLLAELVRKREKAKLRQAMLFDTHIVQKSLMYFQTDMLNVLKELMAMDKFQWFLYPVSETDAPDYYHHIKHPKCWSEIQQDIQSLSYTTITQMQMDVRLVCTNAMTYNTPQSAIHKTASKIIKASDAIFEKFHNSYAKHTNPLSEPASAIVDLLASKPAEEGQRNLRFAQADPESYVDAYLRQGYMATLPKSDPSKDTQTIVSGAKGQSGKSSNSARKRNPEIGSQTPTRRSTRHTTEPKSKAPEPEPLATEPCVLQEMDQKDTFKYFNTGWLLPPGTRRHNRPRPEPIQRAPRKVKRAKIAPHPPTSEQVRNEKDAESSLSELSSGAEDS